ncbi:hypothetical protein VPH35_020151 [Triticum aestivum]
MLSPRLPHSTSHPPAPPGSPAAEPPPSIPRLIRAFPGAGRCRAPSPKAPTAAPPPRSTRRGAPSPEPPRAPPDPAASSHHQASARDPAAYLCYAAAFSLLPPSLDFATGTAASSPAATVPPP